MKNKVYIVGPKFSGKTTFIHKLIERDFKLFKDYIVESTDIPDNIDDAIHVYLLLPSEEDIALRGGSITTEEFEKYMEFYCINASGHAMTIVREF